MVCWPTAAASSLPRISDEPPVDVLELVVHFCKSLVDAGAQVDDVLP